MYPPGAPVAHRCSPPPEGCPPPQGEIRFRNGSWRRRQGRRRQGIEREALLARLHANPDVPVVVVHAGAGFGKSTLAAQWAQRDPRPHVLVRIARFHDDPAALALAIVDALESVGPGAGMDMFILYAVMVHGREMKSV